MLITFIDSKQSVLLLLAILVLFLFFAKSSYGQTSTSNDLYRICTNDDPAYSLACTTYISGIFDGLEAAQIGIQSENFDLPGLNSYLYCVPGGVTTGQLRDMIINYLRDHPGERHRDIGLLSLSILQKEFPCSENR